MTTEMIVINQLKEKLEDHIKLCNEREISSATIKNLMSLINKFYEDKKELDALIKSLLDINTNMDLYIKKANECYEKANECNEKVAIMWNEFEKMKSYIGKLEIEIAILKEGGNI